VWLPLAFVLGAIVGSFLNVCIARLPLGKSLLWPGSHCGSCFQPIRAADNLPILSYLILRGRCRHCGARFSSRYLWVELLTAISFAGLFWLVVVGNLGRFGVPSSYPFGSWNRAGFVGVWLHHAVFLSFLIVAALTDLDYRRIPASVPILGTAFALAAGGLAPWPWPYELGGAPWPTTAFSVLPSRNPELLPASLQPWPVWLPAPAGLRPGTWPMGLATGLAGALLGLGLMHLARIVCRRGLGVQGPRRVDALVLMMIGAFLGWQALLVVLAAAVLLALGYAPIYFWRHRGGPFPFVPFQALGAVVALLSPWRLWE
jgi:leader peptidase (prepilin peptidase)/N-methyltransferase